MVNEIGLIKSSALGILVLLLLVLAVRGLMKKPEEASASQNSAMQVISNVLFSLIATFVVMAILGSLNEGLGFMALFGSPVIFGAILFLIFKSQDRTNLPK